jgi:hypothetical protein
LTPPTGCPRFTAAGGWYCVTGDGIVFGWPVPTMLQAKATREVYREIEDQPDRRDAVAEIVKERFSIAQAGWTTTPRCTLAGPRITQKPGRGALPGFWLSDEPRARRLRDTTPISDYSAIRLGVKGDSNLAMEGMCHI